MFRIRLGLHGRLDSHDGSPLLLRVALLLRTGRVTRWQRRDATDVEQGSAVLGMGSQGRVGGQGADGQRAVHLGRQASEDAFLHFGGREVLFEVFEDEAGGCYRGGGARGGAFVVGDQAFLDREFGGP